MTKNTIFSFLQACEATMIKTAQKSWKGATIGALATFTLYLVIISLSYLKIGISPIADLSIALITVGILSSLLALLSTWGFKIIRLFNPWFVGICLSTYILVGFLPYPDTSRMFIGFELLCGALIGYSVYIGIKKKVSITLILIVLGLNTCVVYFLANEGSEHTTPPITRSTDEYGILRAKALSRWLYSYTVTILCKNIQTPATNISPLY